MTRRKYLHNTFLTGKPDPTDEQVHGHNYPTVVRPENSDEMVLVVQVQIFFRYLGYLKVTFDDEGKIIGYSGKPISLDSSVEQGINERNAYFCIIFLHNIRISHVLRNVF